MILRIMVAVFQALEEYPEFKKWYQELDTEKRDEVLIKIKSAIKESLLEFFL